jgi:hypothetical protein
MQSSGMLLRVASVRTDVSEERSASIIKVKKISELGKLAVTSNCSSIRISLQRGRLPVTANVVPSSSFLVTLMMEALRSSET